MRPSDDANAPRTADPAPATLPASAGGEWLRRSLRLSPWQIFTVTLLGGAIAFGACQGDNLFRGEAGPKVTASVVNSGRVDASTPVDVRVVASDIGGLAYTGARLVTNDTSLSSTIADVGQATDARSRDTTFTLSIPADAPLTLAVIGYARDISGHEAETDPIPLTVADVSFDTLIVQAPSADSTVKVGDSVRVSVYARDISKVSSVTLTGVAIRNQPAAGTVVQRFSSQTVTFPIAPQTTLPDSTTIMRYLHPTADSTAERVAIVVTAKDSIGNVGQDTVWVTMGGPTVRFAGPDTTLFRVGDTIVLSPIAYDSSNGIDHVTMTVSGVGLSSPQTLLDATPAAGTTLYDSPVSYPIVHDTLGALVFTLTATSHTSTTTMTSVAVDTFWAATKLNITIPTPGQAVAIRDSLPVTVMAGSLSGLKQLTLSGVAIRQTASTSPTVVKRYDPTTVTFPLVPALELPDTIVTLTRILSATSDTTPEFVYVVAAMQDSIGQSFSDTVRIQVGGPILRFDLPPSGQEVSMGQQIPVRIVAQDQTYGMQSITLSVNGTPFKSWPAGGVKTEITDTTTVTAPSVVGPVTLFATAQSQNSEFTASATSVLQVVSNPVGDLLPPRVRIANVILPQNGRMELHDSIGVQVVAADTGGAGLRTMGIYVALDSLGTAIDSTHQSAAARPGGDTLTFYFRPEAFPHFQDVNRIPYPALVNLRVQAFALDTARNCGATTDATWQHMPCERLGVAPGDTIFRVGSDIGLPQVVTLVAGRTIVLQPQSAVADIAPDTVRGLLYVANMPLNEVERVSLSGDTLLTQPIVAGSQPWGLDLFANDTLIVANSGGTNVSRITWNGATPSETGRLLTPNLILREWHRQVDVGSGTVKWIIQPNLDFSDRPQYVAEDSKYRVLYSTVPTGTATNGTLRAAERKSGWTSTETWLLNREYAWLPDTAAFVFENVDSIKIAAGTIGLQLFYHQPGDSLNVHSLSGDPTLMCEPRDTAGTLLHERNLGTSIAYCAPGTWSLEKLGLSDTTFVAIARDRSHVSFGEGNTSTGRVFMWNSTDDLMSPDQQVTDIVNNASERVFGLALDMQGKLGVARGTYGSYFYDPNLRLQGIFGETNLTTSGIAMDPHHADPYATNDSTLAFVGSHDSQGLPVVKIVDTYTFRERGKIYLRDDIAGLLKSSMPADGDPASCKLDPGNPNCVMLQLYGVIGSWTDLQGRPHARFVIINVRKSDILP